uniref:CG-1 domain-containing protein n=1 Tax=Caenorhabditis japonica TaxID=281687 RepID=A0A8R1EQH0_CAEJA
MQQPSPPDSNFAPSIQLHYEGEGVQLRADAPHPQQIEWFPRYKNEWNNTQKILQVILAANVDPKSACISQSLNLPRPCHGAHLIYPRLDGAWFKADGYIWRKRKNNRNTREDHMRLKVNGQELINCKYVHSAIVPTFHRRIYFLPDSTHVLVHYLNETPSITDDTAEEIARTIKANNVLISLEQLSEQLDPICKHFFICSNSQHIVVLSA